MIVKRFLHLSRAREFKEDYELFGLRKNPTKREIKEAYYRLAKEKHPDSKKCLDPTNFSEINDSYLRLLREEATGKCSYNISKRQNISRDLNQDGWYAGSDPRQSYFSQTRVRMRKINFVVKTFILLVFAAQIIMRLISQFTQQNKTKTV